MTNHKSPHWSLVPSSELGPQFRGTLGDNMGLCPTMPTNSSSHPYLCIPLSHWKVESDNLVSSSPLDLSWLCDLQESVDKGRGDALPVPDLVIHVETWQLLLLLPWYSDPQCEEAHRLEKEVSQSTSLAPSAEDPYLWWKLCCYSSPSWDPRWIKATWVQLTSHEAEEPLSQALPKIQNALYCFQHYVVSTPLNSSG